MRSLRLSAALTLILTVPVISHAGTISNPLYGTGTQCNYSSPNETCGLIGDPLNFDIQKIDLTVTGDEATATIFFNYGNASGATPLLPYNDDGITLQVGDLFFYNPDDPDQMLYGVAMSGSRPHSSAFTPGAFYQIGGRNGVGVETAETALNDNPNYYYRHTQDVLMTSSGTPHALSHGSGVQVDAIPGADGTTTPFYTATVQFDMDPSVLAKLEDDGEIGLMFASADCGNGVIKGSVSIAPAVPEPSSLFLTGGALLLAGMLLRRRTAAVKGAK